MKESILEINPSAVPNVNTNAHSLFLWRPMKEPTLVINHIAAPSVTTNAQDQVIWRAMKEFTQVINHTVVASVIKNSLSCPTWRKMRKITLLQLLHRFLKKSRKNHHNKIKLYNILFQVKEQKYTLKLHIKVRIHSTFTTCYFPKRGLWQFRTPKLRCITTYMQLPKAS